MFAVLLLLFIAVPILEIYLIVVVADGLGWPQTVGLLLGVSLLGAWMVKAQGMSVLRRLRVKLSQGEMPGRELVDGALVVFAGALMLTPGFATDAVGLLLLFPPTRLPVRGLLIRTFRRRVQIIDPAGRPRDTGGVHDTWIVDEE